MSKASISHQKTFFSAWEVKCKRWFAVVFNHRKIFPRLSHNTSWFSHLFKHDWAFPPYMVHRTAHNYLVISICQSWNIKLVRAAAGVGFIYCSSWGLSSLGKLSSTHLNSHVLTFHKSRMFIFLQSVGCKKFWPTYSRYLWRFI